VQIGLLADVNAKWLTVQYSLYCSFQCNSKSGNIQTDRLYQQA